ALKRGAIFQLGMSVDRPVAQVFHATPADGIESLQGMAQWIDARVTDGAADIARMFLDELTHGQFGVGLVLRKTWHVLGRPRQFLAEKHFRHPVAAQDWAGA